MKFLSLYYTHKPGGLCKRLYRLLGALERRFPTIYLALDKPPVQINGFKQISFPSAARSGLVFWAAFSVVAIFKSIKETRREGVTHLIAFHPFYALLLYPAALLAGGKVVLFFRAVPHKTAQINGAPLSALALRICEWFAILCAAKVFIISRAMMRELPTISEAKLTIIPNDIPTTNGAGKSPLEIDSSKLTIVTSGVFDRRKNASVLIDAIAALPIEMKEKIAAYFVGDGPLLSELKAQAGRLNLDDIVTFTGWIDNFVPPQNLSLFVHPSSHEGMANSVLEAIELEIPVLASKIPEHSEFFPSESLFANSTELAELIANFVKSPDLRSRLIDKQNEVKLALKFNWEERAISSLLG